MMRLIQERIYPNWSLLLVVAIFNTEEIEDKEDQSNRDSICFCFYFRRERDRTGPKCRMKLILKQLTKVNRQTVRTLRFSR